MCDLGMQDYVWKPIHVIITFLGTNISRSPVKGTSEDDFPFLLVGYLSSMEDSCEIG